MADTTNTGSTNWNAVMAGAGAGAGVAGGNIAAQGALDAGNAQLSAAQYEAAQMRQNAMQAQAIGSVRAQTAANNSLVAQSHALAVAAASGGGALDPSVVNVISKLAGEGSLAAQTEVYNGNEVARQTNNKADATVYAGGLKQYAGQIDANAYKVKQIGSLISSASSIYSMFK